MRDSMERLQQAIFFRENGRLDESRALLLELVQEFNHDATVLYQCAWTHDALGMEAEAVPFYEQAIALGLTGDERRGALLGLGSTYRTLGEYEKAKLTFEQGIAQFPDAREFYVFYAMTLYNLQDYSKSMETLLHQLIETTSDQGVLKYKRAILFYADKLDQVWN